MTSFGYFYQKKSAMTKRILFTLSALFLLVFLTEAQQLKAPQSDLSSQILGVLNKTSGLGLTSDQESKLKGNNLSFTNDLMSIMNSADNEETKKKNFLNLKNTRQNFLTGLLGQQILGKYNSNVSGMLKPLKKQLGLAALAF
jgi:hypothetical protein